MAIRKITIKEAFVYDILEKHSSGRRFNFCWERFEWDEARFKYRSWNRARLLGAFYVDGKEFELCKNEVPELLPALQTLKDAMENLKKAQDQFEGCRNNLIREGLSLCKDPKAVHRAFDILTPQEVLLIEEYKSDPSKVQDLLKKIEVLNQELEALPKGRSNAKKRKELTLELNQLKNTYHIVS
jgi:hypothetical protein